MKLTYENFKPWLGSLFFSFLALIMIANGVFRTNITISDIQSPPEVFSKGWEENDESDDEGMSDRLHHATRPIPIIGHIVGGSLMMLSAPVTLNSTLRKRRKQLHRICGYLFLIGGIVAGSSSVWMTLAYPDRFMPFNYATNLLWGAAMVICPPIAVFKVRKKKVVEHRAWMIRAYAVAAGPAIHRLLFFTYIGPLGGELSPYWDIVLSVLTIFVGEIFIRRIIPMDNNKPTKGSVSNLSNVSGNRSASPLK